MHIYLFIYLSLYTYNFFSFISHLILYAMSSLLRLASELMCTTCLTSTFFFLFLYALSVKLVGGILALSFCMCHFERYLHLFTYFTVVVVNTFVTLG